MCRSRFNETWLYLTQHYISVLILIPLCCWKSVYIKWATETPATKGTLIQCRGENCCLVILKQASSKLRLFEDFSREIFFAFIFLSNFWISVVEVLGSQSVSHQTDSLGIPGTETVVSYLLKSVPFVGFTITVFAESVNEFESIISSKSLFLL